MSLVVGVNALHPDKSVLHHAAGVIRSGGIVVYPTETLYGIGADATNGQAVRRVHEAKKRQDDKPILVVVNSRAMMHPLVEGVSSHATLLMEKFWPGPLTLIFRASSRVLDGLAAGTGTIGIRLPSSRLCMLLIETAGVPLTSTSANISREKPARVIQTIRKQLVGIDLYLDAGEIPESLPSTVVDVSGEVPCVVRPGALPIEKIMQVLPGILL